MKTLNIIFCGFLSLLILNSCDDLVEVDPPVNEFVNDKVFTDEETALATLSGMYSEMMSSQNFASGGIVSITALCGLSGDNYENRSTSLAPFYSNELDEMNGRVETSIWIPAFEFIFFSNSILEGISSAENISDSTLSQIEGEARFIRAFSHFYLSNIFGDIPIIRTTDWRENSVIKKSTPDAVYDFIEDDLVAAAELLTEGYSFSDSERIRPNTFVALALLARVNLYSGDWVEAETHSSEVINAAFYSLDSLPEVFLANSNEAIWQLAPVRPGQNTNDALAFRSPESGISLSTDLINSFESGDQRLRNWVDTIVVNEDTFFAPTKYKVSSSNQPVTEYSMVLRLAEQYLIRAEARVKKGDLAGALTDLNLIRARARLNSLTGLSETDILEYILLERRHELYSEWGHRWFDLKRLNKANDVLSLVPFKVWESSDVLYPIPFPEIQRNSNLLPQNPGY